MLPPKKAIDKNQTLYHFFKLSSTMFILYDNLMDMPIQYGSLNVVMPTVESVKKHVKGSYIFFYDKGPDMEFKKNNIKTVTNNKPK